jgi:hypothetical protein
MLEELKDELSVSKSAIIQDAINHLHWEKCEENVFTIVKKDQIDYAMELAQQSYQIVKKSI